MCRVGVGKNATHNFWKDGFFFIFEPRETNKLKLSLCIYELNQYHWKKADTQLNHLTRTITWTCESWSAEWRILITSGLVLSLNGAEMIIVQLKDIFYRKRQFIFSHDSFLLVMDIHQFSLELQFFQLILTQDNFNESITILTMMDWNTVTPFYSILNLSFENNTGKTKKETDGRMEGRTYRRTDTTSYRDA